MGRDGMGGAYQCLQKKDWNLSVSTQLPRRSSPFSILTFWSLHSLFWQPARPVEASSVCRLLACFVAQAENGQNQSRETRLDRYMKKYKLRLDYE